jgi:hypothetical protein
MWKTLRIREALKAAGYHVRPLLSKDRKSIDVYERGEQVGIQTWAGEPWPDADNPAPRYAQVFLFSAPLGRLDLELPAWEAAYKKLMPQEAS